MKTFKQFNEGLKTVIGVSAALAAPYLAKKFLKPKTDKMLDFQRKNNTLGGDRRTELEDGKKKKKKAPFGVNQSTYDALNNPDF